MEPQVKLEEMFVDEISEYEENFVDELYEDEENFDYLSYV